MKDLDFLRFFEVFLRSTDGGSETEVTVHVTSKLHAQVERAKKPGLCITNG